MWFSERTSISKSIGVKKRFRKYAFSALECIRDDLPCLPRRNFCSGLWMLSMDAPGLLLTARRYPILKSHRAQLRNTFYRSSCFQTPDIAIPGDMNCILELRFGQLALGVGGHRKSLKWRFVWKYLRFRPGVWSGVLNFPPVCRG